MCPGAAAFHLLKLRNQEALLNGDESIQLYQHLELLIEQWFEDCFDVQTHRW